MGILSDIPGVTIEWLLEPNNPAVSVLTRRHLLGMADDGATAALWERRNDYGPVAAILRGQLPDGSWATPGRDYQKYGGSLWQIVFLGEMWANADDPRVQAAIEYAFRRQLPDGTWSASNAQPTGSIPCLTANVARGLAAMGLERDERVIAALESNVRLFHRLGAIDCGQGAGYTLNGYCHMLTVKELLFLGVIPRRLWPHGAAEMRDACIAALRDKSVFRSLPAEFRQYQDEYWSMKPDERHGYRERFLAKHPDLHYGPKSGWLRFGFPLSYNSDVLEALWALALVGEPRRPEYEEAIAVVREAADAQMRWTLRNTFNGKMLADVEQKGGPSKWLTLRALRVLEHFGET